jgi:hypothetical protein
MGGTLRCAPTRSGLLPSSSTASDAERFIEAVRAYAQLLLAKATRRARAWLLDHVGLTSTSAVRAAPEQR